VAQHDGLDAALAVIAVIVAAAQIDGNWTRLKACPGLDSRGAELGGVHRCGWAFYDQSRNQSSNWCSMSVCGQREKAREYRQRRRGRNE
jgi:predicted RNA-binding Zn ribbon-like protein